MIYIAIKEMMKAKAAARGRKVTINELANATGISRMTLTRMMNDKSYNKVAEQLDKLCHFFECDIHELVKYVPETESNPYVYAYVNAVNTNAN